jgi:hypothetical protein
VAADRYAIVVGRFYEDLAEKLVSSAQAVFEEAGGEVDVFDVPGAYELPLAARYCADSGRYAGVARSARSSAARPRTTTTSATSARAASWTCSCGPACRAGSAC